MARAEPICRRSNDEVRALAESLTQNPADSQAAGSPIASGLVEPGISILSEKVARLRAIEPAPSSADLETYLGLYDPIVELSRQLLQTTEAGDGARSRALELIIADLGHEQADAGRAFGFDRCALTFTEALGG